ncbi:hypothetical protein XH99_10765 [Bradyrhizobium nanningense]|uniref:Uncharacterized protein n=1 Tax=Bradyrhizobium nanningense TaxID=1325118 RepID=A0A4Q0S8S5_9BRAD|nr:hypothetical protein XH99_10765 [Bradyrhizobium nanningense]
MQAPLAALCYQSSELHHFPDDCGAAKPLVGSEIHSYRSSALRHGDAERTVEGEPVELLAETDE